MAFFAAGQTIPADHYMNMQIINTFALIGGSGCTLMLMLDTFFFSKSETSREVAKLAILPSIFNINEPVLYGAPVVYNPILMVPANLCCIVGTILTWVVLKAGLLAFPNVQATNVGTLPVLACTVMMTGDMRGLLWWVVFFAIYMAIWYPFFKVFEKGEIAKENGMVDTSTKVSKA